MQTETLDTLFGARDKLTDMIINLSPPQDNPAARANAQAQLESLVTARDRVSAAINQVITTKFNDLATGLAGAIADLKATTKTLTDLSTTLANVNTAIQLVDQIVEAVGKIIKVAGV
jgi:hypothetical protein